VLHFYPFSFIFLKVWWVFPYCSKHFLNIGRFFCSYKSFHGALRPRQYMSNDVITTRKTLIGRNVFYGAFKNSWCTKIFLWGIKNMLHRVVELLWRIIQYVPHNWGFLWRILSDAPHKSCGPTWGPRHHMGEGKFMAHMTRCATESWTSVVHVDICAIELCVRAHTWQWQAKILWRILTYAPHNVWNRSRTFASPSYLPPPFSFLSPPTSSSWCSLPLHFANTFLHCW
jgi:hypothetical protein